MAKPEFERVRGHGLSSPAAGKEPPGVGVGGGHGVRSLVEIGQQHSGKRFGDGRRRIAEPDQNLAVLVKNIVGGEPSDPGERLRVKEDERGDHTVLVRNVALVECLPQQGEPLVLGEGVPLCLSSSEAWGSGFVEGAVAEQRTGL
ncbi:hypothetical protein [Streptomyces sioyaensis]|uniref:hypothetical protein n=1 Tax=Streptomyces sioyaensis TaxID=67364 RepID=UPI0036E04B5D